MKEERGSGGDVEDERKVEGVNEVRVQEWKGREGKEESKT